MVDAELVIRYFAFRNYLPRYTGNLKQLLDETTQLLNDEWEANRDVIDAETIDFEQAIQTAIDIFSARHAFRKWTGARFEPSLNRAVLTLSSCISLMKLFAGPHCKIAPKSLMPSKTCVRETMSFAPPLNAPRKVLKQSAHG